MVSRVMFGLILGDDWPAVPVVAFEAYQAGDSDRRLVAYSGCSAFPRGVGGQPRLRRG